MNFNRNTLKFQIKKNPPKIEEEKKLGGPLLFINFWLKNFSLDFWVFRFNFIEGHKKKNKNAVGCSII